MSQLSGNIIVLHIDQVLLDLFELFQFTHGTLFGDTLYYSRSVNLSYYHVMPEVHTILCLTCY